MEPVIWLHFVKEDADTRLGSSIAFFDQELLECRLWLAFAAEYFQQVISGSTIERHHLLAGLVLKVKAPLQRDEVWPVHAQERNRPIH